MAELKIHKVTMPDGEVVLVQGPVDSPQDEMRSFVLSERQAAQKPTPSDLAPGINAERLQQRIEAKAGKPVSTPLLNTIQTENKDDSMLGAVGQAWSSLSPGQQLGVAGAATGLGLYAGYKARGLKDRFFSPEEKPMKVEIVGGEQNLPSAAASAEAEMQRAWSQKYPGTDFNKVKADLGLEGVKLSASDYNYIEKAYQQRVNAGQAPSAPTAAPQASAAPSKRVTFTVQDIQSASPGQTEWKFGDRTLNAQEYADWLNQQTQPPAEAPKTPTAAAETPKAPATPPAEAPALQPAPPPAEAPKAAVPPEKLTKEQKGMKNHLVSMYGGGAEGEAAYAKVKEILGTTPEFPKGQGGGLSPEQTKIIKDWRKANIEGPKVNLTYDMKKALKGGGGLAVLAAIPGFAEAAANKDIGKMTDIATDFLVLPFAQSREVGEGEQFELAKRRYEGMVGGGRGIAPPSPRQQVGRR